jgi:[histone H3]-lysine36 N-dimethyltransferase SETMAR
VAQAVMDYLFQKNIYCVPHPPYSRDLAPCDFFLFPTLEYRLRGRIFENSLSMVKCVEAILKGITKIGLHHVFEDWKLRMKKCIQMNGEYFEKDHVDIDLD